MVANQLLSLHLVHHARGRLAVGLAGLQHTPDHLQQTVPHCHVGLLTTHSASPAWNFRRIMQPFFFTAPRAACPSAQRRNLLAFFTRPLLLFPAERLLPEQMPPQLLRWSPLGNTDISGPISARIAVRSFP